MKALVWSNNKKIELIDKPVPKIQSPMDVIVKVTLSTICTSDLHIINGFVPQAVEGIVLGHEFVGQVIEVGTGVKKFSVGDRVSANCETYCGECWFCRHGYVNNCEKGGWLLGCKIDGCQAEYIRVPYAETSLVKLPDNVSDKEALFVGDILSSGYFGAEMCEIKEGDIIAVIGCGPVGLCAMMCAKYMGAAKIVAIDVDSNRLDFAVQYGLADYGFNPLIDDIEYEIKHLSSNRGADGVIEAAGGDSTFELAWKIARPNAIVGVVAMYEDNQVLPLPQMYGKNLTFKTGGVDAVHCEKLIELISKGVFNTDFLITHNFNFEEIIDAYAFFEQKPQGCLKVALSYY